MPSPLGPGFRRIPGSARCSRCGERLGSGEARARLWWDFARSYCGRCHAIVRLCTVAFAAVSATVALYFIVRAALA